MRVSHPQRPTPAWATITLPVVLLLLGSTVTAKEPHPTPSSIPCVVLSVHDGDTFTCEGGRKVRLLLVDAPELKQLPFGPAAKEELEKLAPVGATVELELDVRPRDRYGRMLAYVWLNDGTMVNEELANRGFAVMLTYPPNVRHVERTRAAVAEARAAKRGLWSSNAFEQCTPRDFRHRKCPGPKASPSP